MTDEPREPEREATQAIPDIHTWFGLSYANYLTVPRSLLQSMPAGWQRLFVALLEIMQENFPEVTVPEYQVTARVGSKFVKDPVLPYDRGRAHIDGMLGDEGAEARILSCLQALGWENKLTDLHRGETVSLPESEAEQRHRGWWPGRRS
jgi:hypothetical protein